MVEMWAEFGNSMVEKDTLDTVDDEKESDGSEEDILEGPPEPW